MKLWANKKSGFTIVELLIVIVVVAILATITVVAYIGVRQDAQIKSVQSAASQVSRAVASHAVSNGDQYPADLSSVGITDTPTTKYQYTSDNATTPRQFCVTATEGDISYYISNANTSLSAGICPGHNLVVWDKTKDSTKPVSVAVSDTSEYHTAPMSMRFSPGQTNRPIRNMPVEGQPGQVVTVSAWVKADASWNGTESNSKIRFGFSSTHLGSCGYATLAKNNRPAWVQQTCTFTLTSAYPKVTVSLGSDSSVGNLWIDDVSVSIK